MAIPLDYETRTGHLPHLLHVVINRLRLDAGTKAPISKATTDHGGRQQKQGYTQVSIFTTLDNNVKHLEFSALLPDVVTIADEADAQLKGQVLRFTAADAAENAKNK